MTNFDLETFSRDHFALFGLPRRQALDEIELEQVYRDVQGKVHPDKHAHLADSEKRLAMQWATKVNEAYLTLKSPLKRAEYLLRLTGHDPQIEHNTAMPADFLMHQMELREAVAEARDGSDADALDSMRRQMKKEMSDQYQALVLALDEKTDYARGAEIVRQLMFQEKLLKEIDEALETVEA
ncbi:MAG TPA: Fe-S protein assembly co-chaperone HscB [Rhodocyclaceae bacterium]|nr:Fe-S protein assembly co-chaperone HscB [Rhodocyclaceae bacterium]